MLAICWQLNTQYLRKTNVNDMTLFVLQGRCTAKEVDYYPQWKGNGKFDHAN